LKSSFDVRVMANTSDSTLLHKNGVDVSVENLPLLRPISPLADIKALWLLFKQINSSGLSAVHTITPKAGLIGMTAAFLARVPVRVHSFTGQVWVTRRGIVRHLLKIADKYIAFLATDILVDSPSQRDFLIKQGIIPSSRSKVLGAGSICGVDTKRFCPSAAIRDIVRGELLTSPDSIVCLYLGRLAVDKGVLDLALAFAAIAEKHSKAELWIVGPDEGNLFPQIQSILKKSKSKAKRIDYTLHPERYMQAADLFCLPSYREGFGSSVIEAAACGLPSLASRIYGLTDAIVEGETGWMHEAGDVLDLSKKLHALLLNPHEFLGKGRAARQYVKEHFSGSKITGAMVDFYRLRLHETRF
jgi:glycosyltransferase involved in cell wall biosynthesis